MKKRLLVYVVTVALFGSGITLILEYGARLDRRQSTVATTTGPAIDLITSLPSQLTTAATQIGGTLHHNTQSPLSILLLQIIVIVIAARLSGRLFRRVGQPAVVGEMVAGVLLGPSLLGTLSPAALSFLFPEPSMGTLKMFSQIGVIIFMFTVGMELNAQRLRERADSAIVISHASIVVPLLLGVTLSLALYRAFAPVGTSFVAFALFIGVAMSITAFPVLARVLEERGLSGTHLGATALGCAAVDDVTAWCLLAVVVAVSKTAGLSTLMAPILFSALFVLVMIFFVKPRLEVLLQRATTDAAPVTIVIAFVFACAWFTESVGIHALFGGFLAGAVMPSAPGFRSALKEKLETLSSSLLLPLFFAFTGLRTQISHLHDWESWLLGTMIIVVAIAGKLGGSTLAARWTGMGWSESFSIGALMNTRGLVELVVLNIGYDLGILSDRIFSIMVLMALVTTAMTGPLLFLIEKIKNRRSADQALESTPISTSLNSGFHWQTGVQTRTSTETN